MRDRPQAMWEFYRTVVGKSVVRDEINDTLGDGPPKRELGALMTRIQRGKTLERDTGSLGDGLFEARLSHAGNEYRLYYAIGPQKRHVLLALKFHQKGSQGAQDREVALARKRLATWLTRI